MGSDFQYTNIMDYNNIITISIENLREKKQCLVNSFLVLLCVLSPFWQMITLKIQVWGCGESLERMKRTNTLN